MLEKTVSGGQTGVDRAAIDASIDAGVPYGGWCPKGRLDELGVIPDKYTQLIEIGLKVTTETENYDTRTKLNITDSDGTLIIVPSIPLPSRIKDGTLVTIQEVISQTKPYLLIDITASIEDNTVKAIKWIKENHISTLNIAGPRESNSVGIYQSSYIFLSQLLLKLS